MRANAVSLVLGALIVVGAPTVAAAQQPPAGSWVRAESHGGHRWTGLLVDRGPDSLRIRVPDTPHDQVVALTDLARLDVRTGRRPNTLRGLGIGLLSGAVLGGALGRLQRDAGSEFTAGEETLVSAAIVGAVGGIVGSIVGTFSQHDVWQRVRVGAPRLAFSWRNGVPHVGAVVSLPLPWD